MKLKLSYGTDIDDATNKQKPFSFLAGDFYFANYKDNTFIVNYKNMKVLAPINSLVLVYNFYSRTLIITVGKGLTKVAGFTDFWNKCVAECHYDLNDFTLIEHQDFINFVHGMNCKQLKTDVLVIGKEEMSCKFKETVFKDEKLQRLTR